MRRKSFRLLIGVAIVAFGMSFGVRHAFSQGSRGRDVLPSNKPSTKTKKKTKTTIPTPKPKPIPKIRTTPLVTPPKLQPKRDRNKVTPRRPQPPSTGEGVPTQKKRESRGEFKMTVNQAELIAQCSDPIKRAVLSARADQASKSLSRGKLFLKKPEYGRAINEFNTAIRINPCFSEAYYIRAYTSNKDGGEIEDVIEDYSRALQLDPKNTDAYHNRGMLLFSQKMEIERAIQDFTKAIELNPDTIAKIYTSRGTVYKFVRNYDAAYDDFKAAIDFDKKFFPAFYYRGITHLAELNYGAAIDDCTKAQLLIDAARSDSSLVQAESYNSYNLDDFGPKAQQCITDANKENHKYEDELTRATTDSPEGFRLRGNIHFKNNKFDLAIGDYKRAIDGYLKILESNPSTPKAGLVFTYLYRGLAHSRKKEYDLAIDDYNKIVGVNQDDTGLENTLSDAWCKRGFAYAGKEEFEKAISDFSKAIELATPDVTDAYYGRGLAYIEMGKLDLAIADLEAFVKFDTKNQPAYLRLAFLFDQISLNEADLEKKTAYKQKAIDMRTKAKAPSSATQSKEENTPKP